jgi:ubiquinone/menaquinone biosynthesis C-methylase UbiE
MNLRGAKDQAGHLAELQISLDPAHPSYVNPHVPPGIHILDLGCGAGQTLIAAYPDRPGIGVDLDIGALRLGQSLSQQVRFVCAAAESLPFRAGSFDVVISRVALPYTDLSRSLPEIRRVLTSGGCLWAVLHPVSVPWKEARSGNLNSYLYFLFVLVNSLLFHICQRHFCFPGKGYETFQCRSSFAKALRRCGFEAIVISGDAPFVVTASAR